MQFTGILDVHDLVADIVGSFHQIDQRITDKLVRIFRIFIYSQFCRYAQVRLFFRLEETELPFLSGVDRSIRVFYDGSQCAVC